MNVIKIDEFNKSKISLNRQILNWEWYTDVNTAHLFIHCLLRANWVDVNYRGIKIKRGQFITSREKLSVETGLTEQQVRTALKHLLATNEITKQNCISYSIITVKKYDEYQENFKTSTNEITKHQPSTNQALTTNNNKNNKNNNINTISTIQENENFDFFGEYKNVYLTEKRRKELEVLFASRTGLNKLIESLSENIASGKEQTYQADLPDAHYIRLKKYYEYWRKHPNKFIDSDEVEQEQEQESWKNEYTPY
jgi:hypothetical protein